MNYSKVLELEGAVSPSLGLVEGDSGSLLLIGYTALESFT